jgi:hypothetical protein
MQFELVCCGARERDRVGFCGNDVKLCSHTRTLAGCTIQNGFLYF